MGYLIFKMVLAFLFGGLVGNYWVSTWKSFSVYVIVWLVLSFTLDIFVQPLFQ